MYGRGDLNNDMRTNGEALIQRCVIDAWVRNKTPNQRGFVVFDVGANVGDWTVLLLKQLGELLRAVKNEVSIYCFEPVPSTNATLRTNLSGRPLKLYIEELALSSKNGQSEIFVRDESNCGVNSLHKDPSASEQTPLNIPLNTAYEFCQDRGIDYVHLMKCDTEGHDSEVIRGALPLLRESRVSVLQFEYNYRWIISNTFLRDVFDILDGLPYMVAKLQADHLLVIRHWHYELERFFEGNYAIVHESAINWFPVRFAHFDKANIMTTYSTS